MNLQVKSIDCFDCGVNFNFSVEEQQDYQSKGYVHAPKRCPSCREARKSRQMNNRSFNNQQPVFQGERRLYSATCAQCSKETQVPFEPKAGRPVYCRECYHSIKVSR
ncbi:MAG TPA: CxxC-x17-CxxC domain-containing protein [Candidatus Limnocylindrales bacterium]|nr:CxxC-x17-CxxC domain-containing protein [Candidatus Limnocylindrales bacterium]